MTVPPDLPGRAFPEAPPRSMRRIFSLEDLEEAARRHLPSPIFSYVGGNAGRGDSARDNRAAFDEIGFLPAVLNDVTGRRLDASVMGLDFRLPFGIAPMGVSALSAYRGDIVLARAARAAGIPMVISGSALIPLEEVAAENPEAWFQAYLPPAPDEARAVIDRVAAAGLSTLVVTVDASVMPGRENNRRAGYRTPIRPDHRLAWQGATHPRWALGTFARTFWSHGHPRFSNNGPGHGAPLLSRRVTRSFSGRDALSWETLALVRRHWPGRLVLKGLTIPADVARAREAGVEGVILSNHGARQLDGTVSPLRTLEASKAVAGDMAVMIDSGFRRGTDILKAFGLGADFVWVGRPFNYAAALGGEAGVAHAIALLAHQLFQDLGMLGLTRIDAVRPEHLFLEGFRAVAPRQRPMA